MADWSFGSGPDDTRSHAEMMMQEAIRRGENPNEPCACGGNYEALPRSIEMTPKVLRHYRCVSCGSMTFDWDRENGYGPTRDDLTW